MFVPQGLIVDMSRFESTIFGIGSDNGLVSNRPQAIIWSNDDTVHQCIYASPGLNELTN